MSRFAIQCVSALGVMVAVAAFDLGPRACAAYRSVAFAAAASDDLGMSDDAPVLPRQLALKNQKRVTPLDALYVPGSGGMSSPGTLTSPDGGSSGAGCLPATDPPAGGLVVYFREPAASFDLTAYVNSILDPPRPA